MVRCFERELQRRAAIHSRSPVPIRRPDAVEQRHRPARRDTSGSRAGRGRAGCRSAGSRPAAMRAARRPAPLRPGRPSPIPTGRRRGRRRRRRRGPRPSPWRPPTRSAPSGCPSRSRSRHSTAGGLLALAVMRIGPSERGGGAVTVSVRYTSPRAGSATAASVMPPSSPRVAAAAEALPQRDVHRPVGSPRPGELAGAVDGVDDPHAVGVHPRQVVDGLLGQHRVAGPVACSRSRIRTLARLSPASPRSYGSSKPTSSRTASSSSPASAATSAASAASVRPIRTPATGSAGAGPVSASPDCPAAQPFWRAARPPHDG